jgi:hypothetical protein
MCATTESKNPLRQAEILEQMLGYVGPGHWLFCATVSQLWKQIYVKLLSEQMASSYGEYSNCIPQIRFSVLSSPSCVVLARQQGLECSPTLLRNVAKSGRMELLKRLHTELHCVCLQTSSSMQL